MKIKLSCYNCQKEFERNIKSVNAARKKGQNKFFCSRNCSATYRNKKSSKLIKMIKTCPICGKDFVTKNGTKEKTFCSVQCGNSVKKGTLNKKFSKVWITPLEDFTEIVSNSYSLAEILRRLGYKSNVKSLRNKVRERILKERIPHPNIAEAIVKPKYDLESIITNKVPYNNNLVLKNKLIGVFHFDYACASCGNTGFHNGKDLGLELHHKDGNSFNNEIGNLEFLCPNCHSQKTMNFNGRKTGVKEKPSKNELESLILIRPLTQIAELYGVTDNALRKWLMRYRLPYTRKAITDYKDSIRSKITLLDDKKK